MAVYDRIGATYARTRRPDPRIAAQIGAALADARSVVNVGAGTGSYEPAQTVVAIEPSDVMIAQRPTGAAPVVQAVAEALPLGDKSVDAALALLTVHHWSDVEAGLAELRRVARHRLVILSWDTVHIRQFWLLTEYVPQALAFDETRAVPIKRLVSLLGRARVESVMVPHDCSDGFAAAYWRRPEAYLDPEVRAGISLLAQSGEDVVGPGMARLAADIESGRWHERHADLLTRDSMDFGYRLVIADL